jgi:hypothetical protein
MADLVTLAQGEKDIDKIVNVVRQLVERFQPSESLAGSVTGKVAKAGDTMTGPLTISASNSTTQFEYLRLVSTDFGSNKPYLTVKKEVIADAWSIILWDGTDSNGTINVIAGTAFQWNGNQIWTTGNLGQFGSGNAGYVPASGGGTTNFLRADATWAAPTVPAAATQSDQETATSTTTYASPGRQQFHPSAAKAWVRFNSAGTVAASYNVSSVTDNGVGDWTVNFATAFSSASYAAAGITGSTGTTGVDLEFSATTSPAAGSCRLSGFDHFVGTKTDPTTPDIVSVCFFGDQ